MLPRHRVRKIPFPDNSTETVNHVHLIETRVVDNDHLFSGVTARPPYPIVLMPADRSRQTVSFPKDVDRTSLPIIGSKNAGDSTFLRGQRLVDSRNLLCQILPTKPIRKELRQ